MDASSGGAEAAEILDMDSGEEEDSSSTCTEEDNCHVSELNAKKINHARISGGSFGGSVTPVLVSFQ